jgi:saccharopine dehydrogenase-like NADP-dependent oxidoreductase
MCSACFESYTLVVEYQGAGETLKKIVVIGGPGAMGNVIIRDLLENSSSLEHLEIADFDKDKALQLKEQLNDKRVGASFVNIKDAATMANVLAETTIVINSTPYYNNVDVMKAALNAKCHYIDLGGLFHVSKKQLELDEQFKKAGLIAVIGMGAAPGLTNVMAASAALELERIHAIDIVVGCADFTVNDHPFLPPYALETLLDEYCKEPMVYEDYDYIAKPPMSGEIAIEFPEPVGNVLAIYTLHSEVLTLPTSYSLKGLQRATFRLGLPIEFHKKLKFLSELGFSSAETISYSEGKFVPRKILAEMIKRIPSTQSEPDDAEVIRVDVTGTFEGQHKLIRHESVIKTDTKRRISCGALDTGVPPAIVADMILNGEMVRKGVLAPENCVPQSLFFERLAKRNIVVTKEELTKETVYS